MRERRRWLGELVKFLAQLAKAVLLGGIQGDAFQHLQGLLALGAEFRALAVLLHQLQQHLDLVEGGAGIGGSPAQGLAEMAEGLLNAEEHQAVAATKPKTSAPGLYTIGYEGLDIDAFLNKLMELLRSHPNMMKRVNALKAYAASPEYTSLQAKVNSNL